MMQKKSKSGFSLAEILVAVGLLGVLAAILVPSLNQFKPNKNKTMFKKAFQEITRISYELVNDSDLYPDGDGVFGFDNVAAVQYNGVTYGDNNSQISDDAKCKFANLFATKLNTLSSGVNCDDIHSRMSDISSGNNNLFNNPSFLTTDGISWVLPKTNFTAVANANEAAVKAILIDTNGDKAPNRFDSPGGRCDNNIDRFLFAVSASGSVSPIGTCAEEYLKEINLNKNATNHDYGIRAFLLSEDGAGHVASGSNGNDQGDDYFDGDAGTCDPERWRTDPEYRGCD